MGRSVLLLHEEPGRGTHYDWLIEREAGGPLVSFRVRERIDLGSTGAFEAERIADHRAEYLSYEGEVSGGRGVVRRVAEGEMLILEDGPGRFVAEGRLGATRGWFEGVEGAGARWEFCVRG